MRKFDFTSAETADAMRLLQSRSIIVEPKILKRSICRDPDDDQVIGTALAGSCECLITGDKDLLSLKRHRGIRIISPAGFWRFEEAQGVVLPVQKTRKGR